MVKSARFFFYSVIGDLVLGGTLNPISWDGYAGSAGAKFDLFDGTLSGNFANIDTREFALPAGLGWDFSELSSDGIVGVAAVPESYTPGLVAGGLLRLAGLARQQRRSVSSKCDHRFSSVDPES